MLKDCHVHSTISHDGKSTIKDYLKEAKNIGVDEITFTEHYDDYEGINTDLNTLDLSWYFSEFLKNKIDGDVNINFGIEVGLQPDIVSKIENNLAKYPFDFIIGSSHITNKKDISFDKTFFEGITLYDAYLKYFKEVLENIKLYNNFDVYGHLDYVVRYGSQEKKLLKYSEYQEILDEILESLIKKDKGIEVNTSGFRYGFNTTHPNFEIIKRYKELGGRILTLGSDAHQVFDLADNFDCALDIIEKAGFNEIAFYHKRNPEFINIRSLKRKR